MVSDKAQRNTRQRQVIFEELQALTSHPTAGELYEIVRRQLPKISLGTVYRNLELLAQSGTIAKLEISGSESRFDGNADLHYHVRCVHCGRVDDAHQISPDLISKEIKNLEGYEILGHRLEFLGICRACQGDNRSKQDNPDKTQ